MLAEQMKIIHETEDDPFILDDDDVSEAAPLDLLLDDNESDDDIDIMERLNCVDCLICKSWLLYKIVVNMFIWNGIVIHLSSCYSILNFLPTSPFPWRLCMHDMCF